MFALKPISHESVASALAKAERYRLLNEPGEAESICRDILDTDPANQAALAQLILALTDQIDQHSHTFAEAVAAIGQLQSSYERAYYEGIAWERRAKARFHAGGHGSHDTVYEWLVQALRKFEEAERHRPSGNDDAILRWNTCVRFLDAHKEVAPRGREEFSPIVSE